MSRLDVVVVGAGPNGLAAAVALAQAGAAVEVLEAKDTVGGGMRTAELTLAGFRHDVCSGCHPTGALSPFFRTLPLEEHGLSWLLPRASVAHPLDDGGAVMLWPSLERTLDEVGPDRRSYRRLLAPLLEDPHGLLADVLGPLRVPSNPFRMARFGLSAIRSAEGLARRFRGERARALFAGCAAHAILPFDQPVTAAVGLLFLLMGHVEAWPVAAGGSASIGAALTSLLESLGGTVRTGVHVRRLADLPPARAVVFDTTPAQLADIAEPALPAAYVRRLRRFRYGPAVFKVDWALDGPIPWSDPRAGQASTVHLGGTLEEIAAAEAAVWRGEHPDRPYVLMVQQSMLDPARAPRGQHTGYGYCHLPAGSPVDMTDRVESQVERFAPGFRDRILARHRMGPAAFEAHNPSYVDGAITGGVADLRQLFTRPVARLDPYRTPNPRILIGSASTPPGAGVHGMGGFFAARSALRILPRLVYGPFSP
ncbi:MAG: phytoene desaturase family protein [Sandaracinaceae bacterium]